MNLCSHAKLCKATVCRHHVPHHPGPDCCATKCEFFEVDVVCVPSDQFTPTPNETTTIRTEELDGLRDRLRAAEHYASIRRHLREELEAELNLDTGQDGEGQTRHALAQIRRWKRIEAAVRAHRANMWGDGNIDHPEDADLYRTLEVPNE